MSTENTQTDVTSSGADAESVSTSQGSDTASSAAQTSSSPVGSFDELKKASKDSAAATRDFKVKSVDEALSDAAPKTAAPPYQPNYKYKAALADKEIEDFWKPLIKDSDSEKRVKEALSRLDGFDFVKQSRDKVQGQLESVQSDYQQQAQTVNRVTSAVTKGDLDSVYRQLGISDEAVYKHVQAKLQRMELPPDQRRAYEEADGLRLQQEQMQEQMTQYQQMYETQAVQARTLQLDFELSRPEIAQAAIGWDSLQGQSGSFRDLIIQEAKTAYFTENVDLSATQAVQRVMTKFGKLMNNQGGGIEAQASQAQAPASQTPQSRETQAKPVIPNVNGKGAAPIKKAPRNLDDLKRMSKELIAQESQSN